MKKFSSILVIAVMLSGISLVNAAESRSSVTAESAMEMSASYQYERDITIYRFGGSGHVKTKTTGRAELYKSGSTYYVKRNGSYYRVYSSNHDSYDYMFHDNLGTWYFN